ncbi:LysR family transcriptional regulator [Acerihabitans arboris]|uniref:LysR family transcriptional regulator n=1 Tax=Acerihabitans arboris TaxID=2691583 RepID=A0A845SQ98_9GAMM|nr:LysR family transcriptional regulator [Acerihabitans arboris]NDL63325.1 LysR family transcriptional regulator [Acerihabitans arboris]
MDLKRLRYFCTIAEQGSISKAAELLNIAQPPLGKRLRELETEIGSPLFIRTPKKMQLTEAGVFLYRHSCEVLSQVNTLKKQTINIATRQKRVVKIGVSYLYLRYFNKTLLDFYQRQPDWDINVLVSDSSHLESLLVKKTLDIALIQSPSECSSFYVRELAPVNIIVVVSKIFAGRFTDKKINLSDIGKLPLILHHRIDGEGTYEFLLKKLYAEVEDVNILMKVSEPRLILEMLNAGLEGVAFMPYSEFIESRDGHYLPFEIAQDISMYKPAIVTLNTAKNSLIP